MKEWLVFLPIVREDWDDMIVGMTMVAQLPAKTAEDAMQQAKNLGFACPILYEDPWKYRESVLKRAGPQRPPVMQRPRSSATSWTDLGGHDVCLPPALMRGAEPEVHDLPEGHAQRPEHDQHRLIVLGVQPAGQQAGQ